MLTAPAPAAVEEGHLPPPRRPRRAPASLAFGALVATAAVLLPLGYLVIRATERGWEAVDATLIRPRTAELIGRSVSLSATVTAISVVLGVGAAWLVTRTDLPARRFWRVAFALPLAIPSYVAAWAWIGWRPELAGRAGATIVLSSISYPYVYLPVAAAMRRADPGLEDVARSLGYGPLRTFFTVTLRQVRISTIGGALLVALYILSDFGAVSIMRFESLAHVIYRSYQASFDRTPAAVLGLVLVALALVIVAAQARLNRRDRYAKVGSGALRQPTIIGLGRWRWPATAFLTALLGISVGVPGASLVVWVQRGTSRTDWGDFAEAVVTTLQVGVLASVATIALALPVGYLAARRPGPLSHTATASAYAGHALPGIVVALSLVFFGVRYANPIYQRLPLLIFAYVVLFLSLGIGAVQNSIAQAPPVLDEVARSLGRSSTATMFGVTFRLASPGIGAGAALVFLTTMKELPATLLLRPTGLDTLATRLWSLTDSAAYAAAAPYAAAIVLLAALPTTVLTGAFSADR